jgi:hypothetical protein
MDSWLVDRQGSPSADYVVDAVHDLASGRPINEQVFRQCIQPVMASLDRSGATGWNADELYATAAKLLLNTPNPTVDDKICIHRALLHSQNLQAAPWADQSQALQSGAVTTQSPGASQTSSQQPSVLREKQFLAGMVANQTGAAPDFFVDAMHSFAQGQPLGMDQKIFHLTIKPYMESLDRSGVAGWDADELYAAVATVLLNTANPTMKDKLCIYDVWKNWQISEVPSGADQSQALQSGAAAMQAPGISPTSPHAASAAAQYERQVLGGMLANLQGQGVPNHISQAVISGDYLSISLQDIGNYIQPVLESLQRAGAMRGRDEDLFVEAAKILLNTPQPTENDKSSIFTALVQWIAATRGPVQQATQTTVATPQQSVQSLPPPVAQRGGSGIGAPPSSQQQVQATPLPTAQSPAIPQSGTNLEFGPGQSPGVGRS